MSFTLVIETAISGTVRVENTDGAMRQQAEAIIADYEAGRLGLDSILNIDHLGQRAYGIRVCDVRGLWIED